LCFFNPKFSTHFSLALKAVKIKTAIMLSTTAVYILLSVFNLTNQQITKYQIKQLSKLSNLLNFPT